MQRPPKICLYLEYLHFLGGFMYKNVGTGLLSSYKNQKKLLRAAGIPFCERWQSDCDILQINTPWLWSLVRIGRAKRQGKKVIIWSHVTAEDIQGVFRGSAILSPLARRYLTYAYGKADMIFSPSAYTKKLLIAYGLPEEKIRVMSNGVDINLYTKDSNKRAVYRTEIGLTEEEIVIGTVGLAIRRKGIDTFLKLADAFPEKKFFWFGKIYGALLAPGLPKVLPANCTFTGYVDDIIAAYNVIDIFLFASYEENEGMSILEAASVGLPIVVRDIPVYEGWLVHGENCLKAKTDEEFRQCVESLLSDSALRGRLCVGARALAERHSIMAMSVKAREAYADLLGNTSL